MRQVNEQRFSWNRKHIVPNFIQRIRTEDEGVLTFEWILLITLLAIGIVGGLSAVRDAIIDELGDVAGAAVSIDQSYSVAVDGNTGMGNAFEFVDEAPNFGDCDPGSTNVSRSRPTTPIVDQTTTSCPDP